MFRYREYCPVALVDRHVLEYGRPEFAVCVSGKVYVMSSARDRHTFVQSAYAYIAARPSLPPTRTACVVSAGKYGTCWWYSLCNFPDHTRNIQACTTWGVECIRAILFSYFDV